MKTIFPSQRGFTLLEGLLGLTVLVSVLISGAHHRQQQLERACSQNAAAHLRLVAAAAERYLHDLDGKDDKTDWQNAQTSYSLERWRYQHLMANGYLPAGFIPNNLYGQQYAIHIQSEDAYQQLLLLTTDGRPIAERTLRQVARHLGSQGGYFVADPQYNPKGLITGSQGSWNLALPHEDPQLANAAHASADPAGASTLINRLASLQRFYKHDVLQVNTLLHRSKIPGKPQLNQMETDLLMQENTILFKNGDSSARLSAQAMQLQHAATASGAAASSSGNPASSAPPSQLTLRCNDDTPHINLANAEEEAMTITSEQVKFSGDPPPLPQPWQNSVRGYSPPELHRYWNKLPYYELESSTSSAATQQFSDTLCSMSTNPAEGYSTIGRLFLIGYSGHPESRLFICRHVAANTSVPAAQAYLLQSLNHSLVQDARDATQMALNTTVNIIDLAIKNSWDAKKYSGEIVRGSSQAIKNYVSNLKDNTPGFLVVIPEKEYNRITYGLFK